MANLRNIKSVPSASVEIKDELGAGTGVFFELAGPTHPKRKEIVFAAARRMQAKVQRAGRLELDDPQEQAEQSKQDLADCTLGWHGYTDDAGVEVPFTAQAARELFADDQMSWLVDQLQGALNEKSRFMKRSASA